MFAELALSLLVAPEDDAFTELAPALVGLASEVPGAAPLGALLDVAALLLLPVARLDEARRRLLRDLPVDAALGAAVGRWLDVFVAPVASCAALLDVTDALGRHDVAGRHAGAILVGSEMLRRRSESTALVGALDAGALRRIVGRPAAELRTRGAAALLSSGRRAGLTARYEALAGHGGRGGELITKADLVLAENAPVLRSRAARTGVRQLVGATEAIALRVPRFLRHNAARGDAVTSRIRDEGSYPMGGFSSVSTAGSLESVVSSELAYLTPGADLVDDLFTVRWALGELLYYTRDESVTSRPRTTVSVHFSGDLALARRKDRDVPYQRATLALAAVCVLVARAAHLLRGESLRCRLVFDRALAPERDVVALALVRERTAKLVEIEVGEEAEVVAFEAEESTRARVVALRVRGSSGEHGPAASGRVVVASSPPSIDGVAAVAAADLDAWARITQTVLTSI